MIYCELYVVPCVYPSTKIEGSTRIKLGFKEALRLTFFEVSKRKDALGTLSK